jgi:hypothetical protein
MKPMPWRILVLTDAAADSGGPRRVAPGGAGEWLASLGASVEVATPAGAVRIEPRTAADFTPDALAARLPPPATPAAIDAVLHNAALQRVESAWRGLSLLCEHAGDAVAIEVFSLPRKGLGARFRDAVFAREMNAPDPLTLILADFDFSHKADDLAALADLAGMAKVLQAPLVASASAAFFDLRYLVQAAGLPDLLGRLGDAPHTAWRQFQATEAARWAALTINRYLQRAPYAGDGGHAETVSESNPDSYLWGRGVWLVGAAVARSVRTHGHGLDLSGSQGGRFDGLAARAFPLKANEGVALATEVVLSETQTLELSRAAFTPIVGVMRSGIALVPIAVTVSRLTPGKLTVEGTLAYQIAAGRLAQFCARLLDGMPAEGAAAVAAFFKTEMLAFLGPLAGDAPEDAVSVEVVEEKGEDGSPVPMALVKVKPRVVLEGKPIDFGFMLPLSRA